jgi:hypothetical protein
MHVSATVLFGGGGLSVVVRRLIFGVLHPFAGGSIYPFCSLMQCVKVCVFGGRMLLICAIFFFLLRFSPFFFLLSLFG